MTTFKKLNLIEPLQRALAEENYKTPTPIQSQTIPAALNGEDVLGCAQTGTGKTAAFALPILNRLGQKHLKAEPNCPIVLVLAPTRELAIQIGESFETYGRHLRLRHVLVYGGVNQANQVRALKRGAHILVATPGRLLDLMEQGHIQLNQLDVFVLDEADRMLDMGFLPDLKRIIRKLPEDRQSLFFSATMPPNITRLSQQLLYKPVSVNVTPKKTSVELIKQQLTYVDRGGKLDLLRDVLLADDGNRAIVFTKTKRGANMLSKKLLRDNIQAVAIHGNKSQNARQRALDAFKRDEVQVLVATDVAARGIDIEGVTHVVNYDIPVEPESYVHRIGRTGRAGAAGIALSFCAPDERTDLRAIERLIGMNIPLSPNQPKSSNSQSGSGDDRGSRQSRGQRRGGSRPNSRQRNSGFGSSKKSSSNGGSTTIKKPRRAATTSKKSSRPASGTTAGTTANVKSGSSSRRPLRKQVSAKKPAKRQPEFAAGLFD